MLDWRDGSTAAFIPRSLAEGRLSIWPANDSTIRSGPSPREVRAMSIWMLILIIVVLVLIFGGGGYGYRRRRRW
jgi:hypothetical protein